MTDRPILTAISIAALLWVAIVWGIPAIYTLIMGAS